MKNLKLFLLAVAFVFTSCETEMFGDDTYSIEYIESGSPDTVVNVSVTPDRFRVANGTQLGFTVSLEQAVDHDAIVTVVANNQCGSTISHLSRYSTATATISAGNTSGVGSLIFADSNSSQTSSDWDGLTGCATVSVSGIVFLEEEGHDHGDEESVAAAEASVEVTVVDVADIYMDVDEDAVVIAFDWKNPGVNDMDLFVSSPAGSIIEASETGSRYEGDYFDNDNDSYYPAADGVYTVWYVPFAQEAADVPAEMFFTHPKTGLVDHISFTIPAGAPLAYTPVADITKTTDADGNMSYEVTAR